MTEQAADEATRGRPGEVFGAFLKLGVTSFGGPIAHLGYFRDELVTRRRWISEAAYAELVALCQFLPGPASSQVGFAMGLLRAGPAGALAAFLGFTLPSAILLIIFGFGAASIGGPVGGGIVAGLKIVAVAVVAQAVWGMARSLAPDRQRASIALIAVLLVLPGGSLGQLAAIAAGAALGLWLCRGDGAPTGEAVRFPVSRMAGTVSLVLFFTLLAGLPLLAPLVASQALDFFAAFYRAGTLVFGGGHVVLPLLETEVVATGWVTRDQFLAGYGAAQAVPGPLFTFAAYLGTVLAGPPTGVVGAVLALLAIFLPGFLILVGVMPFWDAFRAQRAAQAMMRGANAAVVGILGAALYDPVFVGAVVDPPSFALALIGFVLLVVWRVPPWSVVVGGAIGGVVLALA